MFSKKKKVFTSDSTSFNVQSYNFSRPTKIPFATHQWVATHSLRTAGLHHYVRTDWTLMEGESFFFFFILHLDFWPKLENLMNCSSFFQGAANSACMWKWEHNLCLHEKERNFVFMRFNH